MFFFLLENKQYKIYIMTYIQRGKVRLIKMSKMYKKMH